MQRFERGACAILLALVAAAYIGVVHAGFVWDDTPLVVKNSLTGDLRNIPNFFVIDMWDGSPVETGVSGYYRPLMLATLALDQSLFGLSAPAHHLHSLAWHLLAVCFCFRLFHRLVGFGSAICVAAIFGLHPVQSEAVVWISARNDPMSVALCLMALDLVFSPEGGRLRWSMAGLLAAGAVLTKESAVMVPLLWILLAWGTNQGKDRNMPLGGLWALIVGVLIALVCRAWSGVGAAALPEVSGWVLMAKQSPVILGLLGWLGTVGWPLSVGWSMEWLGIIPVWQWSIGLGLLVVWTAGCFWNNKDGERWSVVGWLWAVVTFLPVLVPIADKGLIGERYLYLPMIGVGISVAAILGRRSMVLVAVATIPALLALSVRLPDWVSTKTLWEAAVRVHPSAFNHGSLGHALRESGEPALALRHFEKAVADPVPDLTVCQQLVGSALAMGRPDLAVQIGLWGSERGCEDGGFGGQLAVAMAFVGQWDEAEAVLGRFPNDPGGRDLVVKAALHFKKGETPELDAMVLDWKGVDPLMPQVVHLIERAQQ